MAKYVPVLITAVVTIFGWYATYAYAKVREDRTRRLDLLLKLRAQQIEELYGPLRSLIDQIFNVWRVRKNMLGSLDLPPEDDRRVREFFWQNYFTPLHEEIATLLRTKLYLLEGGQLPASFKAYLEHSTQEACQHRLYSELGIDTSNVPGRPWPAAFDDDVKSSLDRLMAEHQSGLTRLG